MKITASAACRAAVVALAGLVALPASATLIVNDLVESNGGWTVSGNAIHFLNACCGTAPTAGTQYIHIQNVGGRIASKSFSGLQLAAGTYTVSFDIGSFSNAPLSTISAIGLTAGGNLLAADTSAMPTPGSGQVRTWTLSYDIAAGTAGLGSDLGFLLQAPSNGNNRNGSFDNLRIDFVAATTQSQAPEPGSLALAGLALAGVAAAGRRKT